MYTTFLRWSPALGLLLILITLTSTLAPGETGSGHPQGALALRQIAHDYLAAGCDTKSTIPAVITRPDGSFLLPLGRHISYDSVSLFAAAALQRFGITENYALSLEDCASGEVFLGGFWNKPLNTTIPTGDYGVACAERDQPVRCANLSLAFPSPAQPLQGPASWLLFGLGFLLLLAGPVWRQWWPDALKAEPAAAEIAGVKKTSDEVRLASDCTFSLAAQKLASGGTIHELTYREAKLLGFLVEHLNEILERETIQEAVWGDEGIMVGRSLDVFISRLRKKLAGAAGVEIRTVHGVGYQLVGAGSNQSLVG